MSKVPNAGIALARGDCPENAALPPMQAKTSTSQRQSEVNKTTSIALIGHKSDLNTKPFNTDKYSHGDHLTADQGPPKKGFENACICCKHELKKQDKPRQPSKVMYWEIPRSKFGGISVTAEDYRVHKLPQREVPKWHPHRSQPWSWLSVPSITETTYRKDFSPPITECSTKRLHLRSRKINTHWFPKDTGKLPKI